MTKQPSLMRTCTACGIEKPLAAFLYLTGKAGTAYGSICATCRGKGITEKTLQKPVVEEERSSTTSGMRIGVKQLVEIELQKKHDQQERQERQDTELKKLEELSHEKSESTELKEKDQKLLREQYIDSLKNQGFLKKLFVAQTTTPPSIAKQQAIETIRRTEAIQQEKQKTTFDLNTTPGEYSATRDATLQRMQALLGQDAPVMKAMQFYKSSTAGKYDTAAKTTLEKSREETPREFIENKWGPSSRKR